MYKRQSYIRVVKKRLLLSVLLIVSSLSAQETGFGLHYQTQSKVETYKSVLSLNIDYKTKRKITFGIELGVNLINVVEDIDYTGIVRLEQYPQDITGEYTSNLVKFAGRFGYDVSDKITLIATLGLNFLTEYQLRFNTKYDDYAIASGKSPTDPYFKASILLNLGKLRPEIGIGSNGFSIGGIFYLVPFFSKP